MVPHAARVHFAEIACNKLPPLAKKDRVHAGGVGCSPRSSRRPSLHLLPTTLSTTTRGISHLFAQNNKKKMENQKNPDLVEENLFHTANISSPQDTIVEKNTAFFESDFSKLLPDLPIALFTS